MTLQYSGALRDNQVAQIQQTVGTAGVLKFFSGSEPTNAGSSDPSGPLATLNLPSTFLSHSAGTTTISGTWSGTISAAGTNVVQTFRIYDSGGTCHLQGSAGSSGTDMIVNNTSFAQGQTIQVTAFSIAAANG